jgi:hypothetical protein
MYNTYMLDKNSMEIHHLIANPAMECTLLTLTILTRWTLYILTPMEIFPGTHKDLLNGTVLNVIGNKT